MLKHCFFCIMTCPGYKSTPQTFTDYLTHNFSTYTWVYTVVNINIISGSYVNGSTQPTIYSFFPNVSPGYKIIKIPHNLLYLPITSDTIHSITIWITDQNGNELPYKERINQCNFIWERFKKYLEFQNDRLHQC